MEVIKVVDYSRAKGITLVLAAATFWGTSGIFTQYLLQLGFPVEWLVSTRLLVAGPILLALAYFKQKQNIWTIWKYKYDVLRLILFSIIGLVGAQYTFFYAIEYSNAATATVLHYLAPAIIAGYIAIRMKRFPTLTETIALSLALLGTFLLVTQGNIHSLSISGWAFFWGVASAVALAFYTLQPLKLLARWEPTIIVGWGMLIGGVVFSFVYPPWIYEVELSSEAILAIIFTIVFGTILAFTFYLTSLKYISPSETSLLACFEPLLVALISVFLLNLKFGYAEWIGTLCIISTVVIFSVFKDRKVST